MKSIKLIIVFSLGIICGIKAQDLSTLFQSLNASVVTIQITEFKIAGGEISPSVSLGSGVIIDQTGLIMTAAHVVESANVITVKLLDGQKIEAEVIRSIPSADIALIKLKQAPKNLKVAKIGNSDKILIGNQIMIIGAPFGIEHSLSVGHVSGKMHRSLLTNGEMAGFIQTDAAINHGNSGGPMFNLNGEAVGIVSFILSEGGGFDGIGFAVDINTAKKLLLEEDSHFWTGFDGLFLNENLARVLNVPQTSGLLVQRVASNSFAAEIGLLGGFFQAEILGQKLWLGGDIILSILGTSCDSPHNLNNVKTTIQNLSKGDEVLIKVLRHGELIELTRTIAGE